MTDTTHHEIWHTIILGAGASGLMCAGAFAAPKLILEHNPGPGKKLNITGGGKCNFTHQSISEKDYLCDQKHFVHAALAAYPPQRIQQWLQEKKIAFTLQENGCLFATHASEVTEALFSQAKAQHADFLFNTQILELSREKDLFCVRTSKGMFYAQRVVLASGGLSYPHLGASGIAWQMAQSLGLETAAPRAVLAGFRLEKPLREICAALSGNSLPVRLITSGHREEGNLLFTHEGISGPAVLQSSLYWQEGEKIEINFCPDIDVLDYLRSCPQKSALFSKLLAPIISPTITKALLAQADVRAADATKAQYIQAANRLNHFSCIPVGTTGYTHAEATAGGVLTAELDPKTLQCKRVPGLYVIGEAVNVTGRVGGYNLHWAWASAQAAAQSLRENIG